MLIGITQRNNLKKAYFYSPFPSFPRRGKGLAKQFFALGREGVNGTTWDAEELL